MVNATVKAKLVLIASPLLSDMLKTGNVSKFKIKSGLPEDAKIIDASFEYDRLQLLVASDTFEAVDYGAIPTHEAIVVEDIDSTDQ